MYIPTHEPFTWSEFNALPYEMRESVLSFYEGGYDYHDQDFWDFYPDVADDFKEAVQLYDWLIKHAPDGDETGTP